MDASPTETILFELPLLLGAGAVATAFYRHLVNESAGVGHFAFVLLASLVADLVVLSATDAFTEEASRQLLFGAGPLGPAAFVGCYVRDLLADMA